jgi:hypothetical protein
MIVKINSFIKSINVNEIEINDFEQNQMMNIILKQKLNTNLNLFVMCNRKKLNLMKSFKENNIEENSSLSVLVQYVRPTISTRPMI